MHCLRCSVEQRREVIELPRGLRNVNLVLCELAFPVGTWPVRRALSGLAVIAEAFAHENLKVEDGDCWFGVEGHVELEDVGGVGVFVPVLAEIFAVIYVREVEAVVLHGQFLTLEVEELAHGVNGYFLVWSMYVEAPIHRA